MPEHFAIATLVAVDGPSPRDIGAQMLITHTEHWGFLSGGCVEDDVARHGREAIEAGAPRLLRYGDGSPWLDIRLACGAGISIQVAPHSKSDPQIITWLDGYQQRFAVAWRSEGDIIDVQATHEPKQKSWDGHMFSTQFDPPLQIVIIGSDATALALTGLSQQSGAETVIIAEGGPDIAPFQGVRYLRANAINSMAAIKLDRWTAICVVTHDRDDDDRALAAALKSDAFYVGAVGSRARLQHRTERLANAGVSDAELKRLHAPIGLQGFGKSPSDVALSILAEVKRDFHSRSTAAKSVGVSTSDVTPESLVVK
jgi:xanthine dehydrogenase accessory factor